MRYEIALSPRIWAICLKERILESRICCLPFWTAFIWEVVLLPILNQDLGQQNNKSFEITGKYSMFLNTLCVLIFKPCLMHLICLMHQISHQWLSCRSFACSCFDLGCFLQLLWRLWAVSSCKTTWQPGFIMYFVSCGLLFPYCQPGLCASLLPSSSVRALPLFGIKDCDWW